MAQRSWPELFLEQLEATPEQDRSAVVETFVRERRPEDLYLDFVEKKDSSKAQLSDDDRRNYAKAISGFAHSDGGLLVWGIAARKERKGDPESPDVASANKPIANIKAFHTNLNDYLRLATTPPVDGVRNILVLQNQKHERGYLVTYVPIGLNPPYRASICNNNFYKRAGSTFYHMEPYDIRDVINRFNYPKIRLDFEREDVLQEQDHHVYSLAISIKNEGPQILESWKLVVEIPHVLMEGVLRQFETIGFRRKMTNRGAMQYVGYEYTSHPLQHPIGIGVIPILPEDEHELASRYSNKRLYYAVTSQIYRQHLPQVIYWRFYADRAPMLSGKIHVKESYEPGEQQFCFF